MSDQQEQKKEEPWWLALVGGLIMFGGAVWVYLDLTAFEAEGGTRRVNVIVKVLYTYLGKWGVVALMAVGGAGAIWHGLSQLAEQNSPPVKSTAGKVKKKKKRPEGGESA